MELVQEGGTGEEVYLPQKRGVNWESLLEGGFVTVHQVLTHSQGSRGERKDSTDSSASTRRCLNQNRKGLPNKKFQGRRKVVSPNTL